jgi:hypothetical protein
MRTIIVAILTLIPVYASAKTTLRVEFNKCHFITTGISSPNLLEFEGLPLVSECIVNNKKVVCSNYVMDKKLNDTIFSYDKESNDVIFFSGGERTLMITKANKITGAATYTRTWIEDLPTETPDHVMHISKVCSGVWTVK